MNAAATDIKIDPAASLEPMIPTHRVYNYRSQKKKLSM